MGRRPKVISIVGIRPNFVKLAALSPLFSSAFDHRIVHTGQHYDYDMSRIFFDSLEIPSPDYNLEVGSGTHGYQLGEILKRTEGILLEQAPDFVVVYGDGNSTLGGALSASRQHIPVAHVEAGYRSFDMQMPEEVNRTLADHVSTLLFAPTREAARNLESEGTRGRTYLTGDVMVDVLLKYRSKAEDNSGILDRLELSPRDYLLVTIHRERITTEEGRLARVISTIMALGDRKFVFPVHPRTRKVMEESGLYDKVRDAANVVVTEPLNYLDFVALEANASKIVTDSGGVQKEAYVLGVPCVTLRENTELVETVREGWNVLVGDDEKKLAKAIRAPESKRSSKRLSLGRGDSADKISRIMSREVEARGSAK